ncbi:MAG: hypothetical protein WCE40_13810 [Polyangia bacterium]
MLTALLLSAGIAGAQPPGEAGDAQAMAARPLMVGDLPLGTVTVRVGRGSLSNAAVGVDVVASVTAPGGTPSKRTEKTKSDGRATFSALPVGAEFRAEAVVDGERLQTASFAIPAEGGTRLMLVSKPDQSAGAAAPANPHAGAHEHGGTAEMAVGALTGTVAPRDDLAAGTVELRLVGSDSAPITGQEVRLGHSAGRADALAFVASNSDKNGLVRFQRLETGGLHTYTAIVDREGLRLSSAGFRLPDDHGVAGELLVPGHTSDPSVLQVSSSSKLLVDLREDALVVMENLVLNNTSDRIFRAGAGGLAIPLPAVANNVTAIEGGARLELDNGSALSLREAIPPAKSHGIPVQARFGFFLPTAGEGSITIRQPVPLGIDSPVVMVPEADHLTLTAPGLQALAPQTDDRGARMLIFQLASVPRNGILTITVSGLPARSRLGQIIATALVAALIFAVVLGWRRPKVERRPGAKDLGSRRDRLFAELANVERARRAAGPDDAQLAQRRADLVAALEAADRASPAAKSS